jgi:uncharacterized phage infection (PIP) family protein YhgE
MVTIGTLALLAAFGKMGQLLAMVILVYLSLSSSDGTIPIQALPSFFRWIGAVEPLRQEVHVTFSILELNGMRDWATRSGSSPLSWRSGWLWALRLLAGTTTASSTGSRPKS